MIEVESKAQIINPEKLRVLAQKIGRYKGKERKVDDYYTLDSLKSYPKKSLRIRKKSGFYEINFKQRIFYKNGVHAKRETEFKVSDIIGFIKLIGDFGFKKWLTKEKYTELYEIRKNFHIEINHVKNLGWFVEVERLCNSKEIESSKKEVVEIMKKLSVHNKDIIKEGYTKLLWDKRR
jgi:adenylate cyclase, class 2